MGDGLDEEGNVIASAEVARADVGLSHMLGANTNKARVQEEARAMVRHPHRQHWPLWPLGKGRVAAEALVTWLCVTVCVACVDVQRDKAKADHALKVARDKEQQLRETMRKEVSPPHPPTSKRLPEAHGLRVGGVYVCWWLCRKRSAGHRSGRSSAGVANGSKRKAAQEDRQSNRKAS